MEAWSKVGIGDKWRLVRVTGGNTSHPYTPGGTQPTPITTAATTASGGGGGGGAVTSVFTRTGAVVAQVGDYSAFYALLAGPFPWADVTGTPTTIAGYGITNAVITNPAATQAIVASGATTVPLQIQPANTGTADILQIYNGAGSKISHFDTTGALNAGVATAIYPSAILGSGGAGGFESSAVQATRAPTGKYCWDMFRQDTLAATPSWMLFECYSSGTTRALIGQLAGLPTGMAFLSQVGYGVALSVNGSLSTGLFLTSAGNASLTGTLGVGLGSGGAPASGLAVSGPITATGAITQTIPGAAGGGISPHIFATGTDGTMGQIALATGQILLGGQSGFAAGLFGNGFTTTPQIQVTATGKAALNVPLSIYNAIATVRGGLTPQYAKADLTAQSAAITATTIYAVPAGGAGLYRVNWAAVITTAGSVSSVLGGAGGFQVTYTDNDTGAAVTPLAIPNAVATGNTVGTQLSGDILVNCKASTNLQYAFGYTSAAAATMQYALHISVQYLG